MDICLTIFVLLFYFGVSVAGADINTAKPVINGNDANVTFVVGETAILECYIEGLGKYKVGWLRNETRLLAIDQQLFTDDTRYTVERPNEGWWNLHISNVTYRDRGQYICRINTDPPISKHVTLNIIVPAKIRKDVSSHDTTLREGETLTLTCKALGIPEPNIEWVKGSTWSLPSMKGETMNIVNVTREDGGVYYCYARNPLTAFMQIKVTVIFAPEINLRVKEIGHTIGGKIYLECRIFSIPTPTIYWLKDNDTLESANEELYKVGMFQGYSDNTLSTLSLSLSYLQQEQLGVFTCVAENSAGNRSESVHIYAVDANVESDACAWAINGSNTNFTAIPRITPMARRIGQYLGHDVVLECEVTEAAQEDVYWLKDNVTLEFFTREYYNVYTMDYDIPEVILKLKIENVRGSQFGEYKCCAENSVCTVCETVVLYEVLPDLRTNIVTSTDGTTSTEKRGEAPKVSLLAKMIGQIKGSDVILECEIFTRTPTNMYWQKDNEALQSLDKNTFKVEKNLDGYTTTFRLRLLKIRDCQFGNYSCHANNSFGEDFDSVLVYDFSKEFPVESNERISYGIQDSGSRCTQNIQHTVFIITALVLVNELI
ncbi:neurotrimin-like isoform X2 [Ruditapes philippinarum]|uniref:neurotrimin-like isoform X2 n=1 Tax=Ruditapes philippinarum TaxID=129788 RepID=UPI00295AFEB2|nr:neurotrimin-like isoform X2 [Ruditapes philippinarum]